MAFQLDVDDGSGATPLPDLETLRDELRVCRAAIRHWDEVMQQRVAEAHALDGVVASLFSRLTGSREAKIEQAVAQVELARQRMRQAVAQSERLRDRLDEAEALHRQADDDEVMRVGELELLADRLRGAEHPLAEALDDVELALDQARLEMETLTQAVEAGQGLTAYLGAVLQEADARSGGRLDALRGQLEQLPARIARFEDACSSVGLSVSVEHASHSLFQVNSVVAMVTPGVMHQMLSALQLEELTEGVRAARADIQGSLDPIGRSRAAAKVQVEDLEGRRRELLEGARSRS